jgi:hypothetical protein
VGLRKLICVIANRRARWCGNPLKYVDEDAWGDLRVFFAATLGPLVLKVGGWFYELSVKTRKDY